MWKQADAERVERSARLDTLCVDALATAFVVLLRAREGTTVRRLAVRTGIGHGRGRHDAEGMLMGIVAIGKPIGRATLP